MKWHSVESFEKRRLIFRTDATRTKTQIRLRDAWRGSYHKCEASTVSNLISVN